MKLNDLHDALETQLSYPADLADVRDRLGDTVVEAPNEADSWTLTELLDHLEADTYDSPRTLFDAIVSSLPDQYVGRKFYDDRGWNPVEPATDEREDVDSQSF